MHFLFAPTDPFNDTNVYRDVYNPSFPSAYGNVGIQHAVITPFTVDFAGYSPTRLAAFGGFIRTNTTSYSSFAFSHIGSS